jgi:hypothetical protein
MEKNEMGGACSVYGGEETRIQGFWENLKEKKSLGKSRCRWEDNIKMDIQEIGWRVWTGLIWLRI